MNAILLVLMAMISSLSFDTLTPVEDELISFTLVNSSGEEINLKFPGQAITALKARSQTKVNLKSDPKIFFFQGKKKYLLMTVKEENTVKNIIVDKLIKTRKQDFGI